MEGIETLRSLEQTYARLRNLPGYYEDETMFLDFLNQTAFPTLFENEVIGSYLETFIRFDFRDFRLFSVSKDPSFELFFKRISETAKYLEGKFETIKPTLKEISPSLIREKNPFRHEFEKGEILPVENAIRDILAKAQKRESFEEVFPDKSQGIESLNLFYFRCIQPLVDLLERLLLPIFDMEIIAIIWKKLNEVEVKMKTLCLAPNEVVRSIIALYRFYALEKDKQGDKIRLTYPVLKETWKPSRSKLESNFLLTLEHLKDYFERKTLIFEGGNLKYDGKIMKIEGKGLSLCKKIFKKEKNFPFEHDEIKEELYGSSDPMGSNDEALRKVIIRLNKKIEDKFGLEKVIRNGDRVFRTY